MLLLNEKFVVEENGKFPLDSKFCLISLFHLVITCSIYFLLSLFEMNGNA